MKHEVKSEFRSDVKIESHEESIRYSDDRDTKVNVSGAACKEEVAQKDQPSDTNSQTAKCVNEDATHRICESDEVNSLSSGIKNLQEGSMQRSKLMDLSEMPPALPFLLQKIETDMKLQATDFEDTRPTADPFNSSLMDSEVTRMSLATGVSGNDDIAAVSSLCSGVSGSVGLVEPPPSDAGTLYDKSSICSTPASCIQISRTSTPNLLPSTSFIDDLLLTPSTDAELEPDYLAIPRNVQPISQDMQRGWWIISSPDVVKELMSCLNVRGIRERLLQKSIEKHLDYIIQIYSKQKKNLLKFGPAEDVAANVVETPVPESLPAADCDDIWDHEIHRMMELQVLKDIEMMEERVCNASLQGWKMPAHDMPEDGIELVFSGRQTLEPNQRYIVDITRERLLFVEHNVERRYLKTPFGHGNQLNLAAMSTTAGGGQQPSARDTGSSSEEDSDDDDDEETPTRELLTWRSAVTAATSSAQLCLYAMQLNRCIAWEKSIMKVLCQICCQDNNEAELLLCDICDRGYHTYCVRPKLSCIPEGDWYCYECISKASGDVCCLVCGQQGARLATCDYCRRRAHLDCLDPPIARLPKKWTCNSCATEKGKVVRRRNRQQSSSSLSTPVKDSETVNSTPAKDCERVEPAVPLPAKDSERAEQTFQCTSKDSEQSEQAVVPSPAKDCNEALSLPVEDSKIETVNVQPTDSDKDCMEQLSENGTEMFMAVKTAFCQNLASESTYNESQLPRSSSLVPSETTSVCDGQETRSQEMANEDTMEMTAADDDQMSCNGNSDDMEKDLTVCRSMLSELRKHNDAWPFQAPVSSKQFPTYRKVVKCPMDLKTISRKLNNKTYKSREEFVCDVRLMFTNCELFNEDDSSVGCAGRSLQQFFESRWTELIAAEQQTPDVTASTCCR
jgi:hypothetical protein